MGSYVGIGYRSSSNNDEGNLSIILNRSASNALEILIDDCFKIEHPKLHGIIMEVLVLDQINFFELNEDDFNMAVRAIRKYISGWEKPSELQLHQKKVWEEYIEPLIQQDQRYHQD
jgi:hypothetical protein